MAEVTTIQIVDRNVPQKDSGEAFVISIDHTIPVGAAAADTITLLTFQRAGTLIGGRVAIAGTLGASATAQLRVGGVAVAAASTAGGADTKGLSAPGIYRFVAGDKLDLLIAGASVGTASAVKLDLVVCHNPVLSGPALDA